MQDEFFIDKSQVRAAFGRAADSYDAAALLQREVAQRMLERLAYIRQQPQLILDVGSGTGLAREGLQKLYPEALRVALDLAEPMLRKEAERDPWWWRLKPSARTVLPVCADMEQLPLRSGMVDFLWSNFALQWANDLDHTFVEFHRVLKPGALVMFSTFGPDTLKELRAAYAGVDGYTHVNRFVDMHDIGDALLRAGFQDPVMDVEYFTLTYTDVKAVMQDLKAIGAHNVTEGRARGLAGRGRYAAVAAAYEAFRREGRLPATFEVVYGHAWTGAARPYFPADADRKVIPIGRAG